MSTKRSLVHAGILAVLAALLSLQLVVSWASLARSMDHTQKRILNWDELGYTAQADELYEEGTFSALKGEDRPVFSWPVVLFLKATRTPFSWKSVALPSSLFYHAVLLLALFLLSRFLGLQLATCLILISVIWTLQPFVQLSRFF